MPIIKCGVPEIVDSIDRRNETLAKIRTEIGQALAKTGLAAVKDVSVEFFAQIMPVRLLIEYQTHKDWVKIDTEVLAMIFADIVEDQFKVPVEAIVVPMRRENMGVYVSPLPK